MPRRSLIRSTRPAIKVQLSMTHGSADEERANNGPQKVGPPMRSKWAAPCRPLAIAPAINRSDGRPGSMIDAPRRSLTLCCNFQHKGVNGAYVASQHLRQAPMGCR